MQPPKWSLQNKCHLTSLPGLKLLWFPNISREQPSDSTALSTIPFRQCTVLSYCPPSFLVTSVCQYCSPLRRCSSWSLFWNVHLLDLSWLRPHHAGLKSQVMTSGLIIWHFLYATPHPQLLPEGSLKHSLYSTYHHSSEDKRCILFYQVLLFCYYQYIF